MNYVWVVYLNGEIDMAYKTKEKAYEVIKEYIINAKYLPELYKTSYLKNLKDTYEKDTHIFSDSGDEWAEEVEIAD